MEDTQGALEEVMEEFGFDPEWGFIEPTPLESLGEA